MTSESNSMEPFIDKSRDNEEYSVVEIENAINQVRDIILESKKLLEETISDLQTPIKDFSKDEIVFITKEDGRAPTFYLEKGGKSYRLRQEHASGSVFIENHNVKHFFCSKEKKIKKFGKVLGLMKGRYIGLINSIVLDNHEVVAEPVDGHYHVEVFYDEKDEISGHHRSGGQIVEDIEDKNVYIQGHLGGDLTTSLNEKILETRTEMLEEIQPLNEKLNEAMKIIGRDEDYTPSNLERVIIDYSNVIDEVFRSRIYRMESIGNFHKLSKKKMSQLQGLPETILKIRDLGKKIELYHILCSNTDPNDLKQIKQLKKKIKKMRVELGVNSKDKFAIFKKDEDFFLEKIELEIDKLSLSEEEKNNLKTLSKDFLEDENKNFNNNFDTEIDEGSILNLLKKPFEEQDSKSEQLDRSYSEDKTPQEDEVVNTIQPKLEQKEKPLGTKKEEVLSQEVSSPSHDYEKVYSQLISSDLQEELQKPASSSENEDSILDIGQKKSQIQEIGLGASRAPLLLISLDHKLQKMLIDED